MPQIGAWSERDVCATISQVIRHLQTRSRRCERDRMSVPMLHSVMVRAATPPAGVQPAHKGRLPDERAFLRKRAIIYVITKHEANTS